MCLQRIKKKHEQSKCSTFNEIALLKRDFFKLDYLGTYMSNGTHSEIITLERTCPMVLTARLLPWNVHVQWYSQRDYYLGTYMSNGTHSEILPIPVPVKFLDFGVSGCDLRLESTLFCSESLDCGDCLREFRS